MTKIGVDLTLTVLPGKTPDPEFEVWIALQDGDPRTQSESFVLGVGRTEALAIAYAQASVLRLLGSLNVAALTANGAGLVKPKHRTRHAELLHQPEDQEDDGHGDDGGLKRLVHRHVGDQQVDQQADQRQDEEQGQ